MRVHVGWLNNYLYCPRKLFLEEVLKLLAPSTEAAVKGKIRHETFDIINKKEEGIVKGILGPLSFEEIFARYKVEFSRILRQSIVKFKAELRELGMPMPAVYQQQWQAVLNEAKMRAENLSKFMEFNNVFGEELWQQLTPKIESEVRLASDRFELVGVVDRIEKHGSRIVPIEIKTGRPPSEGIWPNHRIQLAAYILMLQDSYDAEVNNGIVSYIDSGEQREVHMNPFLEEEIIKLKDSVKEILKATDLPDFVDNKNKCKSCPLREQCYNKEFMEEIVGELKNKK